MALITNFDIDGKPSGFIDTHIKLLMVTVTDLELQYIRDALRDLNLNNDDYPLIWHTLTFASVEKSWSVVLNGSRGMGVGMYEGSKIFYGCAQFLIGRQDCCVGKCYYGSIIPTKILHDDKYCCEENKDPSNWKGNRVTHTIQPVTTKESEPEEDHTGMIQGPDGQWRWL